MFIVLHGIIFMVIYMIDIIIPAYNAHETICKTLLSICMQNIKNEINVYIIDDCSDKNYDKEYKLFKDKLNLKIVRLNKNEGPGVARNKGLDISDGEYVFFMDADDALINAYSLESLKNNILDNDIAVGIMGIQDENGKLNYVDYHDRCLHSKLYKRSFINKYNIRFNNLYRHEDASFHLLLVCANARITFIDEYVYFYKYSKNGLTHKNGTKKEFETLKDYTESIKWIIDNVYENGFDKTELEFQIYISLVYLYYIYQNYIDKNYSKKLFEWLVPIYKEYSKNIHLLDNSVTKKIFYSFSFNYDGIPKISFEDFLNRIGKEVL